MKMTLCLALIAANLLGAQTHSCDYLTIGDKSYKNCTVKRLDYREASIRHNEGIRIIDMNVLPKDVQKALNYSEAQQAAYENAHGGHIARLDREKLYDIDSHKFDTVIIGRNTYNKCIVKRLNSEEASISHSDGVKRAMLKDLPEEVQKAFGYVVEVKPEPVEEFQVLKPAPVYKDNSIDAQIRELEQQLRNPALNSYAFTKIGFRLTKLRYQQCYGYPTTTIRDGYSGYERLTFKTPVGYRTIDSNGMDFTMEFSE